MRGTYCTAKAEGDHGKFFVFFPSVCLILFYRVFGPSNLLIPEQCVTESTWTEFYLAAGSSVVLLNFRWCLRREVTHTSE